MARFGSMRWLAGGLLALTACLAVGPVRAQAVSEDAVKAGFVYNFVKFTQWAGEREGERFLAGGVESMSRAPWVMRKPDRAWPRGA